jgi:CCR4-NOT transcription complex subunit 2
MRANGFRNPGTSLPVEISMYYFCASMWSKLICYLIPLQIHHAHSGVSGRAMNVGASPAFSSSMNIGGTIQGLSSNLGTGGSRNSVPGMSMSPALGSLGPRITGSGNIVGGSNIGRNISSGGLSVPSIASRMNLSGNAGSGNLNVQGSNRMMNGLLQHGID